MSTWLSEVRVDDDERDFDADLSPDALEGAVGSVLEFGIVALGVTGLIFGIVGALGLLHRRMVVWELREYSAPADFFNLILFVLVFGVALVGFLIHRLDFFSGVTSLVGNLMSFRMVALAGVDLGLATIGFGSADEFVAGVYSTYPHVTLCR